MSTATRFKFCNTFPFCVTDISGSVSPSVGHIDNLTLDQVMGFAWNFENVTIIIASGTSATRTTGGGTTTLNAAMTFGYSPFTADYFDLGQVTNGMMTGFSTSAAVFASCPVVRQPNQRVCFDGAWSNGSLGSFLHTKSGSASNFGGMGFLVGTDPGNAGKYRLYYTFSIFRVAGGGGPPTVTIRWSSDSSAGPGFAALANGSVTICGISGFNWYAFNSTPVDSVSGGGLSVTSGSFTY